MPGLNEPDVGAQTITQKHSNWEAHPATPVVCIYRIGHDSCFLVVVGMVASRVRR